VRQRSGKIVHAWAWEGDANPDEIVSNQVTMEFPRGSGRWIQFPEVDRAGWFSFTDACAFINPAQVELIVRLQAALSGLR
jgi:predicted NUDIX family NTP pyrophosphohydrolase